jgi:transport and Golgi organization protein 2
MCAVIVSIEPSEPRMLLVGIRDEMLDRPWLPPGRYWPELPLVGGRDELAGGTWLAVHPAIPRVACVLNGRGQHAPQPFRRSRGELPLLAGAGGRPALDRLDPAAYDPFHLVVADIASADVLSWNGVRESRTSLGAGTYLFTSAGLDPQDQKALRIASKFAAARPSADPSADPCDAWGGWLTLAAGEGLAEPDPRAISARPGQPAGRAYGTTSVSYVAFGPAGIRYDFHSVPGRIGAVAAIA